MRAALALARRGLGHVWPNPAVGCVIVGTDGTVVGRGWTQPGGRPHAETEALDRAGALTRGATVYVSLEPCNHHGRTPPCSEALIAAGVARVVAAIQDPDPRVSGGGLARLREAGIDVTEGVCAAEAAEVNAGFLLRMGQGRPLVTLKAATTLDGRIATATGESRWITGAAARERAHLMRATHDAVMVGIGTARADDPDLTCRLPGLTDRSPVRIAMDARLDLSPVSRLAATARTVPVWLIALPGADAGRRAALEAQGVTVVEVAAGPDGYPDPAAAMRALGERGLTRLLVEGGGILAAALLRADLADRLAWFRAASVIGGDGRAAIAPFGVKGLDAMRRFVRTEVVGLGDDLLESYRRRD
ncbi:MAG: bifunctional diaminohydroxyphosphoribosylaminopyrimidine deaminase/5-amino-6-(5-phosphoribosylamino)uracil reductase RibD [Alphaproteobacteria bacterium]